MREEEANLSATLAERGERIDCMTRRLERRIGNRGIEMLRGWVKSVVIIRRADGKSTVPLLMQSRLQTPIAGGFIRTRAV